MKYALINNNIIEQITIVDVTPITVLQGKFQYMINIDGLDPEPGIGWTYDNTTGTFSQPV